MTKTTKTKIYNTETAEIVKKVTSGYFGDPSGYENILYRTKEGEYFLYVNGGKTSPFPKETLTILTRAKAEEWLKKVQ